MDSSISSRVFMLLLILVLVPGLALAISSQAEKPPCPCNLRGEVVSWSCIWEGVDPVYPYTLAGVEVRYTDCMGSSAKTVTGEKGDFEFPCIPNPTPGCPFCLRVTNVDVRGYITAFDAGLILRYLVTQETLDRCPYDTGSGLIYPQLVAADVNCQNGINAYDAAMILMYTVNLIDHFDCGDDWVFYPSPNCVEACADDITLYCICIGDVSGPSSGPDLLAAAAPATVTLGLPSHYGEHVEVPVRVSGAESVLSAQFQLAFDPADFEVVSVEKGELTAGFNSIDNTVGGILYVAMAGFTPFSGDGEIAVVTLLKKRPMINTALTRLILSAVLLNEDVPVVIDHEPGTPEIFKLSLGPISPNPAAHSTSISFDISTASAVSLCIYNVEGELVRTVFAGEAQAGPNQVTWDGADARGVEVARGIYFCRIEAGAASATDKIVFIR
jgi:hypothetical protein